MTTLSNWEEKKELEKSLERERKELIITGKKLINKTEYRLLLEKAIKAWEQLPKFLRNKIGNRDKYIKRFLDDEYLKIAKKYKNNKARKAKWENLEASDNGIPSLC